MRSGGNGGRGEGGMMGGMMLGTRKGECPEDGGGVPRKGG